MDHKETAARIIDASDSVFYEVTRDVDCRVCVAVKLLRLKTLVDMMYADYEEYLGDNK